MEKYFFIAMKGVSQMKYFEKPGPKNTEEVLTIARERGRELGIGKIVVASSTGRTAEALIDSGFQVMAVTHQAGYRERASQELEMEQRQKLLDHGMEVLTTTHVFAGVDRALNFKAQGLYPGEIVAHSLRILGQGFKVAVEVATMAMDAGFVKADEDIIAIGGTGKGADCAVVLRPAHSQYIFDTDIKEILCMPRGRRRD